MEGNSALTQRKRPSDVGLENDRTKRSAKAREAEDLPFSSSSRDIGALEAAAAHSTGAALHPSGEGLVNQSFVIQHQPERLSSSTAGAADSHHTVCMSKSPPAQVHGFTSCSSHHAAKQRPNFTNEKPSGQQASGQQQTSGQQAFGHQSSRQQASGQQASGRQASLQQSSAQHQASGQQASGQQASGQQQQQLQKQQQPQQPWLQRLMQCSSSSSSVAAAAEKAAAEKAAAAHAAQLARLRGAESQVTKPPCLPKPLCITKLHSLQGLVVLTRAGN
jgi:hypothetical protein